MVCSFKCNLSLRSIVNLGVRFPNDLVADRFLGLSLALFPDKNEEKVIHAI